MIEKHVEQSLRKAVQDRDGLALKFLIPALPVYPTELF